MKVMICGGGTAGHVYPGLALAEALKQKQENIEVVFVGTDQGLEAKVVPVAGYELETLPVKGMPRKLSPGTVGFVSRLGLSLVKSSRLIKAHKPAVVVGMGGFASFPMVMWAARFGCPTLIHEQNAVPGLANRWLGKLADITALTFDDESGVFKGVRQVRVVGNPVRRSVLAAKRRTALKTLELDERPITILIFGGSRGARKINQETIKAYDLFRNVHNLQVIHISGKPDYDQVKERLDSFRQRHDKVRYHLFPYIDDMGPAYAAADLVISRAGATTLAEITSRGLPAVLIPYPHATDDHQSANAKWLEAGGAARIIPDDNFSSQLLWQAVSSFVYHPPTLREMAKRSARMGRPRAADELAELVLGLAEKQGKGERGTGKGSQ